MKKFQVLIYDENEKVVDKWIATGFADIDACIKGFEPLKKALEERIFTDMYGYSVSDMSVRDFREQFVGETLSEFNSEFDF